MVIHCPEYRRDPEPHEVRLEGDGGTCPVPVCADHKRRIDDGEAWLWVPWNRLKGVGSDMSEGCILMGEELAGYGLVVDVDVQLSTTLVFSPVLAAGRKTTTLTVEGRLFGANQPVSLELVLEAETVARLKEALRFIRL
jgi:hypothetical protein